MTAELERVDGYTRMADLQGQRLAADIIYTLDKHYPGYRWGCWVDENGGIVKIVNSTLQSPLTTHELYGYVLHLKNVYQDPDLKRVVRAGGEILERANMERKAWDQHTLPKRIEGVREKHQPRLDINGNPKVL